ncbi:hypothetical protein [Rhizobium jaguaris]|uniref:hypothetical protein n=1 Tax=Rhizobium jaguaris TaxID=1312183 RepID=UPI0039BF82B5
MSERVPLPAVLAVDAGTSLFRKNTLDEMTVGRTEKPVLSMVSSKPIIRAKPSVKSYEDAAEKK